MEKFIDNIVELGLYIIGAAIAGIMVGLVFGIPIYIIAEVIKYVL